MTTHIPKAGEISRKWFVLDAKGQVLGKLAARRGTVDGKHKPVYTPSGHGRPRHRDHRGARPPHGKKETVKGITATRHPEASSPTAAGDVRNKQPTRIVEDAVRGMLPKSKLGRRCSAS